MREMETAFHAVRHTNESESHCAAENLSQYCPSCSSGLTCCSERTPNRQMDPSALTRQIEEAVDAFKQQQKAKKEGTSEDLSEGELAKRLFGPSLESSYAEGPLDVIMEINGEEDDCSNLRPKEGSKSCSSRGIQYNRCDANCSSYANFDRASQGGFATRDLHDSKGTSSGSVKGRELVQNGWSEPKLYGETHKDDFYRKPIDEEPPNCHFSFNKANKLISEIENCFTETTSLVERTLQSTHASGSHHKAVSPVPQRERFSSKTGFVSPDPDNSCQKTQRIRKSVEEAITLFDSIINEDKSIHPSQKAQPFTKANSIRDENLSKKVENFNNFSSPASLNESFNSNYKIDSIYDTRSKPIYEKVITPPKSSFRRSLFDAEIDELFKECYDLAAIEPSTSLDSCLRNLESLCFQLKKARDNIMKEMKANQEIGYEDESGDDELYKEALSLLRHNRFSLINEVIERKVNRKKAKKKFSLDPPLMGLEGKTHKLIAEVTHGNSRIENGGLEENRSYIFNDNYANSMFTEINSSNSSKNSLFKPSYSVQQDFSSPDYAFDLNSDISTTTNTYESNYTDDSSIFMSDLNNTDVLDISKDEKSSVMSQEETLALYADNQELQESLLSILHSLNDIHNNFLKRRRAETEHSHQSSLKIHNKILSILSTGSQLEKKRIAHDYVNFPLNLNASQRTSFEDDFEAIEKIAKVSDELKNLWLSQTPDFSVRRKVPTRTKSFSNRFDKSYRNSRYRQNRNSASPTAFNDTSEDLLNLNKCYSMPNLIAIDLDTPTEEALINFPPANGNQFYFSSSILRERQGDTPSTRVKNFIKQLKIENEKCYKITLHFLKRIMAACKAIEESEGMSQSFVDDPHQECIARC